MLFFNIVSLYFNTLFNWYVILTIDGTIYPSQNFPFDAAFVCQAGKFWTLLYINIYIYRNSYFMFHNIFRKSFRLRDNFGKVWYNQTHNKWQYNDCAFLARKSRQQCGHTQHILYLRLLCGKSGYVRTPNYYFLGILPVMFGLKFKEKTDINKDYSL